MIEEKNNEIQQESATMLPAGELLEAIREDFDGKWYEETYASDLAKFGLRGEDIFDFYMRIGARMGHDPNERFSEVLYRASNIDVRQDILNTPRAFGFMHYVEYGMMEAGRVRFDRFQVAKARKTLLGLDRDFLRKSYGHRTRFYPDIVDFYFDRARALLHKSREGFIL